MLMTVAEIVQQAKNLSLQEQLEVVKLLTEFIQQTDTPPSRSILELAGLGAEVWQDIDPQAYIDQLRSEWDDRP
jgi:hypothetical protein